MTSLAGEAPSACSAPRKGSVGGGRGRPQRSRWAGPPGGRFQLFTSGGQRPELLPGVDGPGRENVPYSCGIELMRRLVEPEPRRGPSSRDFLSLIQGNRKPRFTRPVSNMLEHNTLGFAAKRRKWAFTTTNFSRTVMNPACGSSASALERGLAGGRGHRSPAAGDPRASTCAGLRAF